MSQAERGQSQFPREGGAEIPGFHIKIKDPKRLYKAIKRGYSGDIGGVELPEVSKKTSLKVDSSAYTNKFSISASFSTTSENNTAKEEFEHLLLTLKNKYGESSMEQVVGNFGPIDSYVITTPSGTIIQISRENQGTIYSQLGRKGFGFDREYSAQLSQSQFGMILQDYIDATQTVIEDIYKYNGKELPQKDLFLSVPKFEQQIDNLKYRLPNELKGMVDLTIPDVSFEDIGGQEKAKRELQKITTALDHPDLYKKWGTHPPKGVLLYGPPGTGKTLLAKALASESNAFFAYVSLSEVTSMWYGETEKNITEIFSWAKNLGKEKSVILFFDEIDSIAIKRDNAHEATQKALNAFLTSLSGFKAGGNVIVMGATNRKDSIEPALLRPDRFDRKIYVGLPDEKGIKQIIDIKKRQAEEMTDRQLFSDIDLNIIIPKMKGYSGADVEEIFRRALEEKAIQEDNGENPEPVITKDILVEIENYETESNDGKKEKTWAWEISKPSSAN